MSALARRAAIALLGAAWLVTAIPAAAELPPEARRLERALAGITGIRAEFVQIRSVSLTGEEIHAPGLLAFEPPGRFRLAYNPPHRQELVVDGDSLWVIMPTENQAQRYPFEADAPGSEVFLLFGGGGASLDDAFEVIQEPWGSHEAALHLLPRRREAGYPIEEIRLVLGENGLPHRLFFREVTGDTVAFTFVRVTRNPPDIHELTRLRLPPGIEVIDGGSTGMGGGNPADPDR